MKYSQSITIECPHCKAMCQFVENGKHGFCSSDKTFHVAYLCSNCTGGVVARFKIHAPTRSAGELMNYSPEIDSFVPRINLGLISEEHIRKDYIEAIGCFNKGFYNASMVIARRAIHQEMIKRGLDQEHPRDLYKQIENSGISEKLKALLQKVKNFGNNGAHPDFCLFDINGDQIDDPRKFAELSLVFLDKYFLDEYETEDLIAQAPSSEKELESSGE